MGKDGAAPLNPARVTTTPPASRTRLDVLSASPDVRSDGSREWRFRFYDRRPRTRVGRVGVPGDGTRVLAWGLPATSGRVTGLK